jgi:spore germination protein KB
MGYINKYQLFTLFTIVTIGGTTVFFMSSTAKNDAWLATLLSFIIGTLHLWLCIQLQNLYPDKNLIEIIIDALGMPIGFPLCLLYISLFIYQGSRSFRDYGELVISSFLVNTPLWVINATFMILMCYIIYLGFETLSHISEILTPIFVFFILSICFLAFLSGLVDLSNLKPFLGEGLAPVIKAAFPSATIWPFGESSLIFLMFWKYLQNKQSIFKVCFFSFIVVTIIIMLSSIIILCTLGLDYASIVIMGLLEVIRNINIAEIITNLDSIGILVLFIGGLFKTIIFLFGAIIAIATLFKIKDYRWIIIPFGIFVTWYSIIFEENYPYHVWLGLNVTHYYIHSVFTLTMPILILIIVLLKKKLKSIQVATTSH